MKLVQAAVVVRWVAILAGVVTVAACPRDPGGTSSNTSIATPTRAELLAEARTKYSYGAERAAVAEETPRITAPGGTLPRITIASATRTDTSAGAPGSRVIARLTSSGAYARLGIAPGVNYAWRDSLGSGTETARTLIIPADTTYPMFWLQHDPDHTPLVAGAAALPRLVMSTQGYGICDSGCGPGHCVMLQTRGSFDATSDSTRIR